MEKFNILVINDEGRQIFPQGINWDKWKKRLKNGLEWIGIGLSIVVTITELGGSGGGGGFRINKIVITPTTDQTRN